MVNEVFVVFDSCAKAYLSPFTGVTTAQAKRAFLNTTKRPDSLFHSNPQDFTLFKLGSFDDLTAQFNLLPTPERLLGAWETEGSEEGGA